MEYGTLTHVLLFQVSPIAQALHKSLIHPLGSNAKRSDHQPLTRPSLQQVPPRCEGCTTRPMQQQQQQQQQQKKETQFARSVRKSPWK
ncbi:hypothetical protein ASPCAL05641 [Aspergillus calidoustus]|uniref:Uncharacterized protein n=1 Tax=Aspergillus calidoustus TaxID=454130 RepID=A0A0U5FY78_ASPCI|nr:hypothetical protein ASPCAL05641 [Aspergillus calidoustus]